METTAHNTKPRIYIACLAAYNRGVLHGAWIDADQEPAEIWTDIWRMLDRSPAADAEEYAIHDYEGFERLEVDEYDGIDRISRLAAFIVEHGKLGASLLSHFGGVLDYARKAIEESYHGCFGTLADYMQEVTESGTEMPVPFRYYIDWQAMARDAEMNGDVFTISLAHNEVHVFSAF